MIPSFVVVIKMRSATVKFKRMLMLSVSTACLRNQVVVAIANAH